MTSLDRALFRQAALGALILTAVGAPSARAAEGAVTVLVEANVESTLLRELWGSEVAAAEAQTATRLLETVEHEFRYRQFVRSPTPAPVKLVFMVRQPRQQALEVTLQLAPTAGSHFVPVTISEPWWSRGHFESIGPPSPKALLEALNELLKNRIADLRSWLTERVPLALGAAWLPPDIVGPRIVVALPWARYEILRQSVFRVRCRLPPDREGILESKATSVPAMYHSPSAAFEALVVEPIRRQAPEPALPVPEIPPDELRQLQPVAVFLKEFREEDMMWLTTEGPK